MGCIQSRFQRLFGRNRTAARQQFAAPNDASNVRRPEAAGGHPRRGATRDAPASQTRRSTPPGPVTAAAGGEVLQVPRAPPRTPTQAPSLPPRARYSPPTATSSKLFQQPGGYRFGDSTKAVEESGMFTTP